MARMVATKAALSIRVDALTDVDEKSEPMAPSIGLENRAKLEARLRMLEQQGDSSGMRSAMSGRKQERFQMNGESRTYNTAADAVDLVSTQREPVAAALQAALDVKAEKRKAKEERRAKKRSEKEADKSEAGENGDADEEADAPMDVDGEHRDRKESKRKRKDSVANGHAEETKVGVTTFWNIVRTDGSQDVDQTEETEAERKARKKARKAEKAAAAAPESPAAEPSKKKRRKSEA